ncbi:MAG: SulP family inorganic anion transporter [Methylotenera sp.]|nr:SulP family inorganic anion transporter [Methylotenera sp.]MDO9233473.1 SulP family inorganic anion transporter [Methylotenera sp.]MDO9389128.1 SulP family inorganic anion transporter [Methylotenera sp.]MDP2403236.1 SulP family inorganic anion transporter [Methylotenera sp.]MDP3095256.1 SulP family inorganic anion transporter [Methylotenera sp.]
MNIFKEFKSDLPASIVVFFVALPLCLGIALASGAPLFSGVIAGVVGGIVVGMMSGSQLGVSGPAAGLAVIVLTAIATLGSFEAFLFAVVLAGVLQYLLGFFKAGFIAYFVPSSVIKGMLTGIGLLIILKQIPYALGYISDYEGSESFAQADGGNTFTSIVAAWDFLTPGAVLIAAISLAILILWDLYLTKKHRLFQILQGPIVVVFLGIAINYLFTSGVLNFSLAEDQLVQLPVAEGIAGFTNLFTYPDFSQWTNIEIYKVAVVMAIVASLETLLCVEATDKIDPLKRVTPTNQELKAQGVGNMISGLIGGLPITQVIVRSSANISFGAKTKLSAILHGVFLLLCALTIANLLNMIPLASLATILIVVGYKLAKPALFKQIYGLGWEQFGPFFATVVAIILTDLLTGIAIGLVVALFFTLHHSYRNSYHLKRTVTTDGGLMLHRLALAEEVSFFNKASIIAALEAIPPNSKVIIDCTNSKSISYDVQEYIHDYPLHAKLKNITVETINFEPPKSLLTH